MLNTSPFALEEMILTATLQANLDTLKIYVPNLHQKFKDYTPENTWVVLDDGSPNLFNNDKCVYENSRGFCREQVEQYIALPDVCAINLTVETELAERFEHTRVLDKINKKREAENPIKYRHNMNEERLDLLVMLGAGLGYQIEELFQQKKSKI
jgi:hypothetical protein